MTKWMIVYLEWEKGVSYIIFGQALKSVIVEITQKISSGYSM